MKYKYDQYSNIRKKKNPKSWLHGWLKVWTHRCKPKHCTKPQTHGCLHLTSPGSLNGLASPCHRRLALTGSSAPLTFPIASLQAGSSPPLSTPQLPWPGRPETFFSSQPFLSLHKNRVHTNLVSPRGRHAAPGELTALGQRLHFFSPLAFCLFFLLFL